MTCITGCGASVKEIKIDDLVVQAVPIFPAPHPQVVAELKEACPKDKCVRLYEWLGKLMVFERQLGVFKEIGIMQFKA